MNLCDHIRVSMQGGCVVLQQVHCLNLDNTTGYGIFFIMWSISIPSFLCNTKQAHCV